jgi:pullulanase
MFDRRSLTSRLRPGLHYLAAACAGLVLLAGCGAGDDGASPTAARNAHQLAATSAAAPVAAGNIRMHFHRVENDVAQWGVYSWDGPQNPSAAWITDRFMFANSDAFGGYVDIPLAAAKSAISFLVTDGNGTKNCGADQKEALNADVYTKGQEIWMLEGDCNIYNSQPSLTYGDLSKANAYWLSANSLAWPLGPTDNTYKLFYAAKGGIGSNDTGVTGADGSFNLTVAALPSDVQSKFAWLGNPTGLRLSDADAATAAQLASDQFAIARYDASGHLLQITSLQTAGMLDDVFGAKAANATLGLTFNLRNIPTFRVWAPTAKSVQLDVYPDANAAATTHVPMTRDASGVWSYTAPDASWMNKAFYTFTVQVLSRWANNAVVTNTVTDPYSLSVNAGSTRSFVANLDNLALKPGGWDQTRIKPVDAATDIALYELHIRDFSAMDSSVPAAHRGKYLAFTDVNSNPMRHLQELANAGLTHVHLLPTFDYASVPETGCVTPTIPNSGPASSDQQAAVAAVADSDCFNWGYDPVNYSAPEGSYATNANDGITRVREFRAMVQALHQAGLHVTMDVVYNHTSQSQQGSLSTLDRIVPAYYYRLGSDGHILNDSCCADTAQENTMMGKLIVDSIATWAGRYKIDSFRFDIMGFTPLDLMKRIQLAANQAAGHDVYLYGEGWNFGAVQNDARFVQARQANLYGTGIGSFNDRMRDTIRGGGCCDSGNDLIAQQGFVSGAGYDPNALSTQTRDDTLRLADLVRVTLSGSLRNYSFMDRTGAVKTNAQLDYFGQPAGYTGQPSESINYIEAHDNQTLFDINAYRLPQSTTLSDRVRVQNLSNAINMLAQGVPFFEAGQEILRSRSMDANGYNSGDWFNRLDYSYGSNNFAVGLPPAGSNQVNWGMMTPILTNPLIKPDTRAILQAKAAFEELLQIRQDSTLFRLRTAQDVIDRLKFYNVGPNQVPGLIAMGIDGANPGKYAGAQYKAVVVLFNVDKVAKSVAIPALQGRKLQLHRVQRNGSDEVVKSSTFDGASGTFSIPPRTTAVFVQNASD